MLLQDEHGRKFPVIYNRTRNEIAMQWLIAWVRNYEPRVGDDVTLELIDSNARLFRIICRNGSPIATDGLYLGKQKDLLGIFPTDRPYFLPVEQLVTHVFICGVTGTGKTVMAKTIIEEAILKNIPAVIVDLKGDLSSLPLIFSTLDEAEFEPWVEVRPGMQRRVVAKEQTDNHKEKLRAFGLTQEDMTRLKGSVAFAVFTPKVGRGIPLAIASPLAAPSDITELLRTDPETVLSMADSFSQTFVKTLFPEQKPAKLKKNIAYLQELVRFCWERGIDLHGQTGLANIQKFILTPPIQELGGMAIDDFIGAKNRNEFASRVAMALSGAEQLWFKGIPLEVDVLLDRPDKSKNPVSIVNLSTMMTFDDQMHAVSHLAYALYSWARRQGDSAGMPRLLFFIDEIGGGGGNNAFFPSHPYDPPSKHGLNLLLRQGRAFGLCCIFATQNPGDVDYKGLSNCQTWAVSRLQTQLDRTKIRQGMSAAEIHIDSLDTKLSELQPGEFLVKPRTGETRVLQQRWLLSYHKTLPESEVAKVNAPELLTWFNSKYNTDVSAKPIIEESYYEILEVSEKASPEIIERAYKVLAKKYHPDMASDTMSQSEAEEKMKRINIAYDTLSDPILRSRYDQQRRRSPSRT